jgi:peptidoglycan/LPS O-acetylase OafA/YrhL
MPTRRYETLDALRGVAALAVVIFHLRAFNLAPALVPAAHLAVDFFFVLSGFVVAHAYGEARLRAMSWAMFAERRAIRLMPLAVLGALLGLIVLILKWRMFPGREDPLPNILISGLLNLFMLPSFISGSAYEHGIFPGDGPLWSLFFELAINLIWGWIGVRLTIRQLAAWVALAAVCLVALSIDHGSTRMGVGAPTFWGGLARANFGFCLGVLLYRLRGHLKAPARTWGAPAAAAMLVVAFCAPNWVVRGPVQTMIWDLAWILVILPAVVVFGAGQTASGPLSRALGEISYPVYVLHWPCLAVFSGLRQKLFTDVDPIVFCAAAVTTILLFSWLVLKLYDEPVRRWLSRRLSRAPRAVAVSA